MSDAPQAEARVNGHGARATLHAIIVSPDRIAYDGPVDALSAPARQGVVTILLHHAPMLTILEPGELSLRHGGQTVYFAVGGGHLEVVDDVITILADSVERPDEIDAAEAEAACNRARAMLTRMRSRPDEALLALRRSQARLQVARRGQTGPSA